MECYMKKVDPICFQNVPGRQWKTQDVLLGESPYCPSFYAKRIEGEKKLHVFSLQEAECSFLQMVGWHYAHLRENYGW